MARPGIVEGDRVSIEGVVTGINPDGSVSLALDSYTLARIIIAEHWLTSVEKGSPAPKRKQKRLVN